MLSLPSALPPHAVQADQGVRSAQLQAQLLSRAHSASGKPQDTKEAAEELGALFVLQVLQAMRRTVPKTGLLEKGFAHDTYLSMFDQEIARHIAQREDLGLQVLLQRQLTEPGTPSTSGAPSTGNDGRPGAAQSVSKGMAMEAYRQQGAPMESLFIMPLLGRQTSGFGMRVHPLHQDERLHSGVDIAAPAGTPIRAAAAGEVIFSGTQTGYGKVVIVQHADGYSTLYAHNTENLVTVGSPVQQGQPIATVGRTGTATGPHLHFEIRHNGTHLDPLAFFAGGQRQKKIG